MGAPDPQQQSAIESRLQTHVGFLARSRDPFWDHAHHQWVQDYLCHHLAQWGVVASHGFSRRGRIHQNWILELKPSGRAVQRHPVIVGAHYDGFPGTPGADDNASGLAILLELARELARSPLQRPIWLVAFDLEEYGLLGSTAYARYLRTQGQAIRLMLSLEMLGYCDRTPHSQRYPHPLLARLYPHTGDFVALIGTVPTLPDLMQLQRHIQHVGNACQFMPVINAGRGVQGLRASDHASFWDQGYRAVLVTDTAYFRNPHYHQSSDRLETLDFTFMAQTVQGLSLALRQL